MTMLLSRYHAVEVYRNQPIESDTLELVESWTLLDSFVANVHWSRSGFILGKDDREEIQDGINFYTFSRLIKPKDVVIVNDTFYVVKSSVPQSIKNQYRVTCIETKPIIIPPEDDDNEL